MRVRVVGATEFKTNCLALLDEIDQHGGNITITKRGRPVAVLGPAKKVGWKSPWNSWSKKAQIVGDIENLDMSDLWECARKS